MAGRSTERESKENWIYLLRCVDMKSGAPVVQCIDIYNAFPTLEERDALSGDLIDLAISHLAS